LAVLNHQKGMIDQMTMPPITDVPLADQVITEGYPEAEKEMINSLDDRNSQEKIESEEEIEDLYNLKNFSL
jgi:hypothetical protein